MTAGLVRWLKRAGILAVVVVVTLFVGRIVETQRGPPLRVWHTYVPEELTVDEMERTDWAGYVKAEAALFERLGAELKRGLEPEDRIPGNRYFDGSPIYPPRFQQDWNRSYVLEPDGPPLGAVVFLHGLTDSPYSLRHIARLYRAAGWVSVAPRLPAHGTVPAALSTVEWEEWHAATRLAVREARRRAGPSAPLHIVGFSNGGALAMMYALDALGDKALPRPDRLDPHLPHDRRDQLRPLRRAGRAPRHAAALRQGGLALQHAGVQPVQVQLVPGERRDPVPPADAGAPGPDRPLRARGAARGDRPHPHLPVGPRLHRPHARPSSTRSTPTCPGTGASSSSSTSTGRRCSARCSGARWRPSWSACSRTRRGTTGPPSSRTAARTTGRRSRASSRPARPPRPSGRLGLYYPQDVFSLSHVALPFPPGDALYGLQPDGTEDYGIALGAMAGRGERGALVVSLDALLRVSSNPFFAYVIERVDEGIVPRRPAPAAR